MAKGNTADPVNGGEIAYQIGLKNGEEDQAREIATYLEGEGLIRVEQWLRGFPASVRLTHEGLREIEDASQSESTYFQHRSLDAEPQESQWDVFISHASEDKKDVVEPLAKELRSRNLKVWYDKWVLKIGDRLLEKIDYGLLQSRYGIVVLSPNFLRKDWPKNELDGLIQKEVKGRKVILPIWHNLRRSELISYSPVLAGRLAGSTETGIKALAEELIEAMEDLPIQTEEVVISKSFDINASFKKVSITGDLHKYSFIFGITLNTPPAKNNFLVRLYWPFFIRVTMNRDFTDSRTVMMDGKDFTEYSYQSEQRLYPGDTFEVVSPKGRTELEYEFDHNIWSKVEHGKHEFLWEIYFEDQLPVKGAINFKQLNIF